MFDSLAGSVVGAEAFFFQIGKWSILIGREPKGGGFVQRLLTDP